MWYVPHQLLLLCNVPPGREQPHNRGSRPQVFRNWHPGPLGFQVVSDAIAYYYLNAVLNALAMIAEVTPDIRPASTTPSPVEDVSTSPLQIAPESVDVGELSSHHDALVVREVPVSGV